MALKKDVVITQKGFNGSLIASDAYWKVQQVVGDKNKVEFSIAALEQKDGIFLQSLSYSFVPDLTGSNFIRQAYEFAKKQPEFSGAQDC